LSIIPKFAVAKQKFSTMDKNSKKNLVGQPIFKQILKLIPGEAVDKVILREKSDRYSKSFSTWDELTTLLFGIFERCDTVCEVCDGMATMGGNLNYLGMDSTPTKSIFNDGLNKRSEKVFEKIYFALLSYFCTVFVGQPKRRHQFRAVFRL
jgi:hypothetical protein